jgi:2,3-bisphosphoglycerate-dependent phosphoglycerate mutase
MSKLILLRHGESMWNKHNLFTGWVDVPLSKSGVQEALNAGKEIADIPLDVIFCSTLNRGINTAMLAMTEHHSQKTPVIIHESGNLEKWGKIYSESAIQDTIPVFCAWQLNERMYGRLQGLNKKETMDTFGKEQVQIWRRSYKEAPPEGESLEMTLERTLPFFKNTILPYLQKGKNVLISAHGNSLRACVKYIENIDDSSISQREIATGKPFAYEYHHNICTPSTL